MFVPQTSALIGVRSIEIGASALSLLGYPASWKHQKSITRNKAAIADLDKGDSTADDKAKKAHHKKKIGRAAKASQPCHRVLTRIRATTYRRFVQRTRRVKFARRAVGNFGHGLGLVVMGLELTAMLKEEENQRQREQLRSQLDDAYEDYRALKEALIDNEHRLQKHFMTSQTRKRVLEVVDGVILPAIGFALEESRLLAGHWDGVVAEVGAIERQAEIAVGLSEREQTVEFRRLLGLMVNNIIYVLSYF